MATVYLQSSNLSYKQFVFIKLIFIIIQIVHFIIEKLKSILIIEQNSKLLKGLQNSIQ